MKEPDNSFFKELKKSSPLLKFAYGLVSVPPILTLAKIGYDLLRYQGLTDVGKVMAGAGFISILLGGMLFFIGTLARPNKRE